MGVKRSIISKWRVFQVWLPGGLLVLAAVKLLLHLLTNHNYGYFIDELYYIACSDHLDFGYVDHPPMIAIVTWITRKLLGDSLPALRFMSAVAGSVSVIITGLIVRSLGGNRFAQLLAGLAIIICPLFLFMNTVLTMNAFDILFWSLAGWLVVLIINGSGQLKERIDDKRYSMSHNGKASISSLYSQNLGDSGRLPIQKLWLILGMVIGLGLMNKVSLLFFSLGLVVGLLLTSQRRHFLTPGPWCAGAIAGALFLPYLIWQVYHDWPTLEFIRRASEIKNRPMGLFQFLGTQIFEIHPLNFVVLLFGLWYFLKSRSGRQYRLFGWLYMVVFLILMIGNTKPYYMAPIYPLMLAGGAVFLERLLVRNRHVWPRVMTIGFLVFSGAVTAPLTLPVLPVETFVRYQKLFGGPPPSEEQKSVGVLPQHFADMFGNEELVAVVAEVYNGLSAQDQSRCAIYGMAYPQAGAVDFFGPRYGIPKAISGHNNYWLWGPGDYSGEIMIVIGLEERMLSRLFAKVILARVFQHPYAMPWRNNMPIFICRGLHSPLKEVWSEWKEFL